MVPRPSLLLSLTLGVTALVVAPSCIRKSSDGVRTPETALDVKILELIAELGLTGDPSTGRVIPDINDPLPLLGRRLFFTQSLGGQFDAACASCHHPVLGAGDDLVLPVGVDAVDHELLGPGRTHAFGSHGWDGGPTVPRNSPTTFNVALWDEALFWDGRVESLDKLPGLNGSGAAGVRTPDSALGVADPDAGANLVTAQARFPVTSPEEMKGFTFENGSTRTQIREHLEARMGNYGIGVGEIPEDWLNHFRVGFNDPFGTAESLITFDNITQAIAEYERSQTFVETRWKDYVEGDLDALGKSAKRGALLFFRNRQEGGANCVACHSGDFFTDEQFYAIGLPQVGRGKDPGAADFGRFRETGLEDDRYAFRTPSLINVAATGPWGHAGAHTTLEGIIEYHANPVQAWANYDFGQLPPDVQVVDAIVNTNAAIGQVLRNRALGVKTVQNVELSPQDVKDLANFLRALTDPRVLDPVSLEPWIERDNVFDGNCLVAHDENGDPL